MQRHEITAEVKSPTTGQVLMNGFALKVCPCLESSIIQAKDTADLN